jgi:hypothetical protein
MGKKSKKSESVKPAVDVLVDVPSRMVSGVMGLIGFAMASVIGVWAGNPASVTLSRALVACALCAIVGRALGAIGEICVREFVEHYQSKHPRPKLPDQLRDLEMSRAAHEHAVDEMRKKAA